MDKNRVGGNAWYKSRYEPFFIENILSKLNDFRFSIPLLRDPSATLKGDNVFIDKRRMEQWTNAITNLELIMRLGIPELVDSNKYRIFVIQKLLCLTRTETDDIRFIDQRSVVLHHIFELLWEAQKFKKSLQLAPIGSTTECICSMEPHLKLCPLHDIRRNELDMVFLPLSVGMKVRRGPDWKWDMQDGGVGGIGLVIEIKDWKGEHNKGVRVRWYANGVNNMYRYGGEGGLYDIIMDKPTEHPFYQSRPGINTPSAASWPEWVKQFSKTDRLVITTGSKRLIVEPSDLQNMIPSDDPNTFQRDTILLLLSVAYSDIEHYFEQCLVKKDLTPYKDIMNGGRRVRTVILFQYQIYLMTYTIQNISQRPHVLLFYASKLIEICVKHLQSATSLLHLIEHYHKDSFSSKVKIMINSLKQSVIGCFLSPMCIGLIETCDNRFISLELMKPLTNLSIAFNDFFQRCGSVLSDIDAIPAFKEKATHEYFWIWDLYLTIAYLTGKCCCSLVCGSPETEEEEQLRRWLNSALFAGGVELVPNQERAHLIKNVVENLDGIAEGFITWITPFVSPMFSRLKSESALEHLLLGVLFKLTDTISEVNGLHFLTDNHATPASCYIEIGKCLLEFRQYYRQIKSMDLQTISFEQYIERIRASLNFALTLLPPDIDLSSGIPNSQDLEKGGSDNENFEASKQSFWVRYSRCFRRCLPRLSQSPRAKPEAIFPSILAFHLSKALIDYIKSAHLYSPTQFLKALEESQKRAEERAIGLDGLTHLLSGITFDDIIKSVVLPYWISLKGSVEWCSYTKHDANDLELEFTRHHYLKGIAGVSDVLFSSIISSQTFVKPVISAFLELQLVLITKLESCHFPLGNLILMSLCIDYHPIDFDYLNNSFLLDKITSCFSIKKVADFSGPIPEVPDLPLYTPAWIVFSYICHILVDGGSSRMRQNQLITQSPIETMEYVYTLLDMRHNVLKVLREHIIAIIFEELLAIHDILKSLSYCKENSFRDRIIFIEQGLFNLLHLLSYIICKSPDNKISLDFLSNLLSLISYFLSRNPPQQCCLVALPAVVPRIAPDQIHNLISKSDLYSMISLKGTTFWSANALTLFLISLMADTFDIWTDFGRDPIEVMQCYQYTIAHPCGFGSSLSALSLRTEIIYLFRTLMKTSQWRDYLLGDLLTVLLECYHDAISPKDITPKCLYTLSVLSILGGSHEVARSGARIENVLKYNVNDDRDSLSAVSYFVQPKGVGTIIQYSVTDTYARVLYDGSLCSENVLSVNLEPVEEVVFPYQLVQLSEKFVIAFRSLIHQGVDRYKLFTEQISEANYLVNGANPQLIISMMVLDCSLRSLLVLSLNESNRCLLIDFNILQELFLFSLTPSPIPQMIASPELSETIDALFCRIHDFHCGIELFHQDKQDQSTLHERRQLLVELTELGFNIRLCEKAITVSNMDKQKALDWLTSPEAAIIMATGAFTEEDPRKIKAQELSMKTGYSPQLCHKALLLKNDVESEAAVFLYDYGYLYQEGVVEDNFLTVERLDVTGEESIATDNIGYLLEEADNSEIVNLIPSETTDIHQNELKLTGYLAECDFFQLTEGNPNDPWVCPKCTLSNPSKHSKCEACSTKRPSDKYTQLKPGVKLTKGTLLTDCRNVGPVQHLIGQTGCFLQMDGDRCVIQCVDGDTGICFTTKIPISRARAHEKWFGARIPTVNDLYGIYTRCLYTSFLHLARIYVLCQIILWSDQLEQLSLRYLSIDPFDIVSFVALVSSSEGLFNTSVRKNATLGRLVLLMNRALFKLLTLTEVGTDQSIVNHFVNSAVQHILLSTKPTNSGTENYQVVSSFHPYYPFSKYRDSVRFSGASGLWTVFNRKCQLISTRAELTFYTDASYSHKIYSFSGKDFKPFFMKGDCLFFEFISHGRNMEETAWGYHFAVYPVVSLEWRGEDRLLEEGSIEWSCWILSYMISENRLDEGDQVYQPEVYESLVGYILARGAPHKDKVIQLFLLIRNYNRFHNPIRFHLFEGIQKVVLFYCQTILSQSSGGALVPSRVSQLLELVTMARLSSQAITGEESLEECVMNVVRLTNYLSGMIQKKSNSPLVATIPINLFVLMHQQAEVGSSTQELVEHYKWMESWTTDMDFQLVEWISLVIDRDLMQISPSSLTMDQNDLPRFPFLARKSLDDIKLRFCLFVTLNRRLDRVIDLLNLLNTAPTSLGYRLCNISHCIFQRIKERILNKYITMSTIPRPEDDRTKMILDNHLAFISMEKSHRLSRPLDIISSECLFIQFHNALQLIPDSHLRWPVHSEKGVLFSVSFAREEGIDYGGIYRETLERCVDDLFADIIDLFIPCPNSRNNDKTNADKYVPNPNYYSVLATKMFTTVGKLIGISLRTNHYLPFLLPSIIWKQLVGREISIYDLEDIDSTFVQTIQSIQGFGAGESNPAEAFDREYSDLYFTVITSNSSEEELIPNGANNRMQYCNLSLQYRMSEFDDACDAILEGLSRLVPPRALKLFTWNQLELLVCGNPVIDLDLLKERTVYEGYTVRDQTIEYFWKVMEDLNGERRSQFLRFSWGRSRLPSVKQWTIPFKIVRKNISLDNLPAAHTCFFQLDLPPYENMETLRTKLLAAINFGLGEFIMR